VAARRGIDSGVEQLTVYTHFPDERSLYEACQTHWLQASPPPDPSVHARVADPAARTTALERTVDLLLRGRRLRGGRRRRIAAALAVALEFSTWEALIASGLDDDESANVAAAMVAGVT
jgi:AcrR family transcriptional regulator